MKALLLASMLLMSPSISLDQPAPRFHDTVTYTATYPKEATIKVGRQQMNNPGVQTDCYQSNVRVFTNNQYFVTEHQNGDGTITGTSGPVTLGNTSNGNTWTSGGATCYGTLYYFSRNKDKSLTAHVLDQTTFEVAP